MKPSTTDELKPIPPQGHCQKSVTPNESISPEWHIQHKWESSAPNELRIVRPERHRLSHAWLFISHFSSLMGSPNMSHMTSRSMLFAL
jgi:hypothetical protein